MGCPLEVIVALAGIGTAVTLYPVLKRQNEGLALGFVTSRLLEAAMIFAGVASLLSLVTSIQGPGAAAGPNAAALVATGDWDVAFYNATFLLGQSLMPAINAILLGTLLYQSRLVPRVLPILGLIGAPLLLTADIATLFGGIGQHSTWTLSVHPRWRSGTLTRRLAGGERLQALPPHHRNDRHRQRARLPRRHRLAPRRQ